MIKKSIFFIFFALIADVVLAANDCKILVVVGMEDERLIAQGDAEDNEVQVVVGTANATVLRERLNKVNASKIKAVFSFGVAGGLNPSLKPGDLLVSTQVLAQNADKQNPAIEESWMADQNLLMAAQLLGAKNASLKIIKGVFLGTDFEARDNLEMGSPEAGNKNLRDTTGADIIDNESHIAAKFSNEYGLPFMSIRAISDSVNNPLPPAALIALDDDGSPNGKAIAKSIIMNPLQIPSLIRTAWQYHKALHALQSFRNQIGFTKLVTGASCH